MRELPEPLYLIITNTVCTWESLIDILKISGGFIRIELAFVAVSNRSMKNGRLQAHNGISLFIKSTL